MTVLSILAKPSYLSTWSSLALPYQVIICPCIKVKCLSMRLDPSFLLPYPLLIVIRLSDCVGFCKSSGSDTSDCSNTG